MRPRTEDEVLTKAPIAATFGSEKHEIPLLAVFAQRKWRLQLETELKEVVQAFNPTADNAHAMKAGLTAALLQMPEKIVDLVFAYAPSLDREKILADSYGATEEQFATAFSAIMQVAYPFLTTLGQVTAVVRAQSQQQRPSSSRPH